MASDRGEGPETQQNGAAPFAEAGRVDRSSTASAPTDDIRHLAELVPVARARLDVDSAFPDDAILASLKTIAARSAPRERWCAAFDSNLGHWLALKGADLNAALGTLLSLLPAARS